MDEQDMDVFEHDEDEDLDAEEAMPGSRRSRRMRQRETMRRRASERMDEMQRQALAIPRKVVGTLPVQTREHLRQSARESVLAVQSFVDAVSAAGVMAVDRVFADPRSPQETAQPRRIVIEREEPSSLA